MHPKLSLPSAFLILFSFFSLGEGYRLTSSPFVFLYCILCVYIINQKLYCLYVKFTLRCAEHILLNLLSVVVLRFTCVNTYAFISASKD